jgi:hypothetical protein
MRSEHLSNVHPGWVIVGFVVAIAVTAVLHLALVATGFLPPGPAETLGNLAAIVVGFFAGGFFVGLRWSDAPALNGAAIVLVSALLWFAVALFTSGDVSRHLTGTGTAATLGSLLLQLLGAIAGALAGRATVLGGHVPEPDQIPPEA